MERENNMLHFRPDEKDKFLRAIKLVGIFSRGFDQSRVCDLIKHEKAHIDETERLGHSDKIEGYVISLEKNCIGSRSIHAYCLVDFDNIPSLDMVKIFLVPEKPSLYDVNNVLSALGYSTKEIKYFSGTHSDVMPLLRGLFSEADKLKQNPLEARV